MLRDAMARHGGMYEKEREKDFCLFCHFALAINKKMKISVGNLGF